jgi:RND family efflux transporter MFP subunit
VSVQRLGDLLIDRELRAPATVVSANHAVVTSQVTALIDEVLVDVGADVKRGSVLVRLDDDNSKLALNQARASLKALNAQIEQAELRLKKAEDLLDKKFISDEELIDRRTNLAVLEAKRLIQLASIRVAELDVARTTITAPFDAAVVGRQAQVGSLAMPGTPLMTLVQTDGREVDVELDPRYSSDLQLAAEPRFVSQDQVWPLKLERLSSVIDPDSRIQRARFSFIGTPARIGTSGELVWLQAEGLVPVPIIVQRNGVLGVFIANSKVARFVPLQNAQEGRPARANLPPDTLLIVRGQSRLQDGDTLKISYQ